MAAEAISRFSPGRMSPETLKAIFVQRHDLLARIVEGIRHGAGTQARHHVLLIGPRGVGKTHLISLINHEIRAIENSRIRVAWLMEDETSDTFVDLLARIWTALEQAYPDEFPHAMLDAARSDREQARTILQEALIEHLEGRTLVVLVENLDEHLKNMGPAGQHELRGFLQESGAVCLIASAQQLSEDIGLRKSPLFGSFAIEHLEPLDAALAAELLCRIAEWKNDASLRAYLGTEEARRRIQVILHLAGGNHRVFVILAEFLTRDSLDALVPPFKKLLDEMTPYYQSRIAWVSPQQRKIVELLCRSRRPVAVKQIAHTLFMSEQTASSQLKKLANLRYVNAAKRGRESLYELAEPLMRLCWEVKESRGEPIRLLVDFLRAWFDRPELKLHLARCDGPNAPYRPYLEQALRLHAVEDFDSSGFGPCRAITSSPEFQSPETISEADADAWGEVERRAAEAFRERRWDEAIARLTDLIQSDGLPASRLAITLVIRGAAHIRAGRFDDALADFSRVTDLPDSPPDIVAVAWITRGQLALVRGQTREAAACFQSLLAAQPTYRNGRLSLALATAVEDWAKGFRDFARELRAAPDDIQSNIDDPAFLFHVVLQAGGLAGAWDAGLNDLAALYGEIGRMGTLGAGLVESLIHFRPERLSKAVLDEWLDALGQLASRAEAFVVPVRLYGVGLRSIDLDDPNVLLDLPVEERRIVAEVLERRRGFLGEG